MMGPLIITRPWESVVQTAKYERMLQRRGKILQDLPVYRRYLGVIEEILGEGVKKEDPILEVACGMGFELLELSNRGWNAKGLEIDPNLCVLTSDASEKFGLRTCSIPGDACSIPVADNTFAAVFFHSFFEHVYNVNLALSEQIRILRPGGLLVIFDGNLLNPKLLLDLLLFYPLRTRGRYGGLKWLFFKGKVHEDLYGYLPFGRDEDVKTPGWWKRRVRREPQLKLRMAGTGGYYRFPKLPGGFSFFLGHCVVIAEKVNG